MNLREEDIYNVVWENLQSPNDVNPKSSGSEVLNVSFVNLLPVKVNNNDKTNDLQFLFYMLTELIQIVFSTISYIGPLREEPSRRYIYEDEIIEVGNKGENAAYIFLSEMEKKIENSFFLTSDESRFYLENEISLSDAVGKWNELMKIKNFKAEHNNDIIRLSLDSSSGDHTRVSIADVGFGVSQIFPIILEGLRMTKGGTLLLEQPEIHLHPNLQMQLADYFISLALSGKKVIIETHSDHMINRIVRRIIEDNEHKLAELIGLYFINSSSEGSQFQEVIVDEMTGIINWPDDFFDQTANEQMKIVKASINKKLNSNK